MKPFVPHFQGSPWRNGARVLHVYATPDPDVDAGLIQLADACRSAMTDYPIVLLGNDLLHITLEMCADTTSDNVSSPEREEMITSLRRHLEGTRPFTVTMGSPLVGRGGVVLDTHPDTDLVDLRDRIRDALRTVRGPDALQHDGGRAHMSLGYSYDSADSDPLQRMLRRITPSHASFRIAHVQLLDVQFTQRPQPCGKVAWEMSWETVATIPLGRSGPR